MCKAKICYSLNSHGRDLGSTERETGVTPENHVLIRMNATQRDTGLRELQNQYTRFNCADEANSLGSVILKMMRLAGIPYWREFYIFIDDKERTFLSIYLFANDCLEPRIKCG